MLKIIRSVLEDERGATAIEYGLMVSLMAIAAITAFNALAAETNTMWTNTSNALTNATP